MSERDHVMLIANSGWNMVRFRTVLVDAYVARGLRVTAVADMSPEELETLRAHGAEAVAMPIDSAGQNPVRDLDYLRRMTALLRRTRPDVVHLFTIKPLIYGAIAAKLAGVKGIVASVTGRGILASDKKRWLRPLLRQLMAAAVSGRTRCIFQNVDDQAWFQGEGLVDEARGVHIPGSGVDTEALRPDPAVPPAARRAFIMAARMLWSKGVEDFVKAARLIKAEHPDTEFILFGGAREDFTSKNPDFIERSWLEALNREGVVAWRGFTPPPEVEAAMQRAAAVVLPSYYAEGVPRALIEGAAAGAPIITTDMPGCRDIVLPGRSGFVVPPKSPDALADAMRALASDPNRLASMSEASRRHAERFDSRAIIDKTLATYAAALDRDLRRQPPEALAA